MKYFSVVCVLSAFVAVSLTAPTALDSTGVAPIHNQVKRQTSDSQAQAIDRIVTYSNNKLQQLRRLCPQLFQIIDSVIQNVTSQVFRVVGGALLRSGGLGGGGGGGGGGGAGGAGRVSVVLPTFPPDEDDDDDDDDDDDEETSQDLRIGGNISVSASTSANALSANVSLPSSINEIDGDTETISNATTSSSTSTAATATTFSQLYTSPLLSADTVKRHIRKPRDTSDQEASASGGNGPDPADDLENVDSDDADRNKRYLPFGGDGGSGGGSGNFLYDLFRNTADRAARAVGTVYRMVAGTENLGFGITATATGSKTLAAPFGQLVIGSGATEQSDEQGVGGVAEVDVAPKTEGIPGPITRLLVIANRGIANLIQDLILRLAQTSERIVNFKARLVTALI